MYHVTLNNRDFIFDSADGFETFAEALEWANDRGGIYVAQFENTNLLTTALSPAFPSKIQNLATIVIVTIMDTDGST